MKTLITSINAKYYSEREWSAGALLNAFMDNKILTEGMNDEIHEIMSFVIENAPTDWAVLKLAGYMSNHANIAVQDAYYLIINFGVKTFLRRNMKG